MSFREFIIELALDAQANGIGEYAVTDADDRTIYIGNLPQDVEEAIMLITVPSPPPHQYVDTEYLIIDFWARSPHTDRAYALLRNVYNLYHRRYDWNTDNWLVYWSRALGSIEDSDRDLEGGKLLRLSIQFVCRNLTNIS